MIIAVMQEFCKLMQNKFHSIELYVFLYLIFFKDLRKFSHSLLNIDYLCLKKFFNFLSMSDSNTNLDDHQSKNETNKRKRKGNEEYIEVQLQAYISRLKSDKIPINIGIEQPNSSDHEQWSAYLKEVKKYSEEMKRNAEWTYVGVLIIQTHKIMQILKSKKFKDDGKRKKDLMTILTNSIPDDTSVTQAGRCKQVYDHISDLISKLENQEIPIPIETWYPLLYKAGINFRFLHDSNFKRKKNFKLYEDFINLLISECKKKISKALIILMS